MRLLISAACLLWLAANAVSRVAAGEASPAFYPIGIYGVRSTNDFPMVKQAGFNVVTGPLDKPYLDAAQAAGLKVLAGPDACAGVGFDAKAAKRAVKNFDRHPALWAWYLSDEPDLNLIPPEAVVTAQRTVKEAGARKPTALVIYQGYSALDYANLADSDSEPCLKSALRVPRGLRQLAFDCLPSRTLSDLVLGFGAANDAKKHNERQSKCHQNRHQKNCEQNSHVERGLISRDVKLQYSMRCDSSEISCI